VWRGLTLGLVDDEGGATSPAIGAAARTSTAHGIYNILNGPDPASHAAHAAHASAVATGTHDDGDGDDIYEPQCTAGDGRPAVTVAHVDGSLVSRLLMGVQVSLP